MTTLNRHRVLIACDDSPAADAALATATQLPWPSSARARAVVARYPWLGTDAQAAQAAERSEAAAAAARRVLARRWRDPEIAIIDEPPVDAILSEAVRYQATVLLVGWRGHGTFKRMLTGSVSRSVAARAECPVLVVRDAPRAIRRFLLAYDGSPNAERAIDFMASLEPDGTQRVVLAKAVDPLPVPRSLSRVPAATRAQIRVQAAEIERETYEQAQSELDAAAALLRRRGWETATQVLTGAPLDCLVREASESEADLLVVGARGASGIERVLLGSVADGVLERTDMPVLFVR